MKKYIISSLLMFSVLVPVAVFAQAQADTDPNASISSCVSINNNLRYKTRDASVNGEVSDLQDFLQSQNYLSSEPTGYFGLLTMQAVKAFQKANGISPTGYVGPATRAKIGALTCGTTTITTTTPLTITNTSLPNAQVGTPYEVVLGLLGGPTGIKNLPTTSFKWSAGTYLPSVYNGSPLPPGLFLITNSNNQTVISGTPSQIGTYDFSLDADYQPTATIDFQHASRHLYLTVGSRETSTCSTSGYDTRTGFRCGCTSTFGYSSTTGMACDGSVPSTVIGCTTTSGFSTTTGEYCDGSHSVQPNYLPGCSSTLGFSTTTGEYCDGTHPLVLVKDPTVWLNANDKGATTIESGQAVKLTWGSTNVAYCVGSAIGPTSGYTYVYPIENTTYSIHCYKKIPVNETENSYPDVSASVAVSVQVPISACSTSGFDTRTGFRCGCSSTSGWSSTTGQSCKSYDPFSVLFPTEGSTLIKGQIYKIGWLGYDDDPSGNHVMNFSVYLVGGSLGTGSIYLGTVDLNSDNWFSWTVPYDVASGAGYQIQFSGAYASGDNSDSFRISVPLNTLPAGCSSDSGFSAITGEPCGLQ